MTIRINANQICDSLTTDKVDAAQQKIILRRAFTKLVQKGSAIATLDRDEIELIDIRSALIELPPLIETARIEVMSLLTTLDRRYHAGEIVNQFA